VADRVAREDERPRVEPVFGGGLAGEATLRLGDRRRRRAVEDDVREAVAPDLVVDRRRSDRLHEVDAEPAVGVLRAVAEGLPEPLLAQRVASSERLAVFEEQVTDHRPRRRNAVLLEQFDQPRSRLTRHGGPPPSVLRQ
jgi:hypothetical protein